MLDLYQHLLRQMAFSRATFGPAERRDGVIDHIRKELTEVATADTPMARHREWTDVVILALDGLTRSLRTEGYSPGRAAKKACELILEKQSVNESRDWPDWRGRSTDKAIEHVRAKKSYGELIADLYAINAKVENGRWWRHLKSGTLYRIHGLCIIEASGEVGILYAIDKTVEDPVFCRPASEFLDGRFEFVGFLPSPPLREPPESS